MDLKFHCYACSQPLVVDDANAGQSVNCPQCGTSLTIPKSVRAIPPAAAPPSAPALPALSYHALYEVVVRAVFWGVLKAGAVVAFAVVFLWIVVAVLTAVFTGAR